ncbi:Ankyrin repeat-containing protein [Carex littledalei]|uniref:Ankyrin repeat-containing protein n=1 Tax=Carex littledalei TaxID=544730 RepID=A0A833VWV2_9POAL|nr:Ankyrin repeat-containing protein [Carex littledalei]
MSNSARSTSSSANSASSSSPPDIPMDPQLRQSMSNSARSASSSSPPVIPMDPQLRQLLKACSEGDVNLCINLIDANPDILLSTTPHKNNCLHIAAMLGHHDFANQVWSSDPSRVPYLLNGTNADGETPLMVALMAPNLLMASSIITVALRYMQRDDLEEGRSLSCMLLKVDRRNENVLHHAMRNGMEELALWLLEIEPRLSVQATNTGESPMYMAVRRGYSQIVERLLQIESSMDSGPIDQSALHVAVQTGNTGSLLISPILCMLFFILTD